MIAARRLLALVVALVLAIPVVRDAGVRALAERSPAEAARIWRGHPAAELSLSLIEIGRAAGQRQPVPPAVFGMMSDAAAKAPLAAEPFLVRGVQAQLAGDPKLATEAFEQSALRDPRSLAAHYFLADAYFRAGDARRGLQEVLALSRLAPNGTDTVAPYIAAYARDPKNWAQLRILFEQDPVLEDASLAKLGTSAINLPTVLALANWRHVVPGTSWVRVMSDSLVTAGQYQQARALWARQWKVALTPGMTVYDPAFSDSRSATPFNWELVSSPVGLAERQSGGRLHAIFYGQQDGVIARQLLVLPPGAYRLALRVGGDPSRARALHWSIRCDRTERPFAAVGLDELAARPWTFGIPPGCSGQWLELSGTSSDIAQQVDVTIDRLQLVREGAHG